MQEQSFGKLSAVTRAPPGKSSGALVLLHGVGSNELNMLELGPMLTENRLVVSLRAPINMGINSFAWFHVQFSANGPIHNWNEAQSSFLLIEEALRDLSKKSGLPIEKISVFGFSQGAIMTIGLALQSKLTLEKYIAASGRTLPEFAQASVQSPLADYPQRKIFIAHGTNDEKLPVSHARATQKIMTAANLNLTYKEYSDGHSVPAELISNAKDWLEAN